MYRPVLLEHRCLLLGQYFFCRNHKENDAALHKTIGRAVIPNENNSAQVRREGRRLVVTHTSFYSPFLRRLCMGEPELRPGLDTWCSTMSISEYSGREHLPGTPATPRIPCFFAFYFNLIVYIYHLSSFI